MNALLIAVALTIGQQPANAPPVKAPDVRQPKAAEDKRSNAMVVFANLPKRAVPGFDVYRDDSWDSGPAVLVYPKGINFPGTKFGFNADDATIRRTAGLEVAPRAVPFPLRLGEVPRADGDEDVSGRLTFLRDLVPYATARNTQITGRRVSGYIGPSPRAALELRWNVPGGLDNVHGWSSRLLKSSNAVPTTFLVRQDPSDSVSAVTWGRSYPDGSVFADELRNAAGKVFEVRVAEKHDGRWDRYVVYRNYQHAPQGFRKFKTSECAGCHNQAGSAEYGGSAVPGADTIISDPIDVIERGQTVQGGNGVHL